MVGLTIMVGPWRSTLIVRNTFCDDFPIILRLENLFWFWIHPKLVETIHQHRTDDVRSCIGGADSSSSGAIWWFFVILQYLMWYCDTWCDTAILDVILVVVDFYYSNTWCDTAILDVILQYLMWCCNTWCGTAILGVILQYCISWYHSHPGLEEDHMNMLV